MIDEITDWGLPARPVVADAAYGDATGFGQGLTDRGLTYVLAVSAATSIHLGGAPVPPVYSGTGRPPVKTTYPDCPSPPEPS
jgi:SRSO17 transposase